MMPGLMNGPMMESATQAPAQMPRSASGFPKDRVELRDRFNALDRSEKQAIARAMTGEVGAAISKLLGGEADDLIMKMVNRDPDAMMRGEG